MKRLLRYVLNIIASLFILMALSTLISLIIIPSSIKTSKHIETLFIDSAKHIRSLDHVPTEKEFYQWANQNLSKSRYFLNLQFHTLKTNNNTLEIPENEFSFSLWRGEWYEHYYSWKKEKSTLATEYSDYFLTGNVITDFILFFLIAFYLFKFSFKLKNTSIETHNKAERL